MLKPAICYKEKLLELFAKEIYTPDWFYYAGWHGDYSLPNIQDNGESCRQYAIIGKDDNVIGYLAYHFDCYVSVANGFGLYSFDRGNLIVGKDLADEMDRIYNRFHRIEYRMIGGNHVQNTYEKFCKKYNGTVQQLHDVVRDEYGNYHDEFTYEIINPNN